MELKPGTELFHLVYCALRAAAENPDPPAPHCSFAPADKALAATTAREMAEVWMKHDIGVARILKRLT